MSNKKRSFEHTKVEWMHYFDRIDGDDVETAIAQKNVERKPGEACWALPHASEVLSAHPKLLRTIFPSPDMRAWAKDEFGRLVLVTTGGILIIPFKPIDEKGQLYLKRVIRQRFEQK